MKNILLYLQLQYLQPRGMATLSSSLDHTGTILSEATNPKEEIYGVVVEKILAEPQFTQLMMSLL